jgi:sigma-E factor negative regulatory protein RseA
MNDINEKISALLDDDLSAKELDELIRVMESGDSNSASASRYQMVGEAIRHQFSDASLIDIRSQVSAAIAAESLETESPRDQISKPVQSSGNSMFDLSAWFRPLGGLAVAASVALVTVVAVMQMEQPGNSRDLIANTEVKNPDATVVNIPATAVAINDRESLTVQQSQNALLLDAYLAEHAEFAAQDTMQGRMPYARAVSYDSR